MFVTLAETARLHEATETEGLWVEVASSDAPDLNWTHLCEELNALGIEMLGDDEAEPEYGDAVVKVWCAYVDGVPNAGLAG